MRFERLPIEGARLISLEPQTDVRGFFARTYCEREFVSEGLKPCGIQSSLSMNRRRGTLRGLHYQRAPMLEPKLVRCIRGAFFEVLVDLRENSSTRGRWHALELSADNRLSVYVPAGVAHGFQTLTDETEVWYQMGQVYSAEHAAGIRWNDPAFRIRWPIESPLLSERDASFADYQP